MPCKDGKYLWVRLVGVLTNETFNGIPVVYTIYSDVSELIGTQIELREEHQKLDKTLLLEETTIECIKNLYKFYDLDIRISEVLEKIANVMEADATYKMREEYFQLHISILNQKISSFSELIVIWNLNC